MTDGTDWIMRPILRGLCRYGEVKSGEVNLADIARMNDAIDVFDENAIRVREANDG